MVRTTILVVEDDAKIRTLLRNVMEGEGFDVLEAENAAQALAALKAHPLNLITLDIHLGAEDGFDLARKIRTVSQVPMIMVTGKDDVIDRVVGLEIGADDYITKPFHVREVIARVRSLLRRSGASTTAVLSDVPAATDKQQPTLSGLAFDEMTAIPDRFELRDRVGGDCALTSGDFRLLLVFLQRAKRILSRDQLMDLIGGGAWSPLDRTIDNQVSRLRKKIERDPAQPKLIKTVRGVGYVFASDVRAVQVPDETASKA
jgi:DNA-binding response OmpR family regulator